MMHSEEDRGASCQRNIPEKSGDAIPLGNEACGESPHWLVESGKTAA